ncbi:hypothetical protein [Acidicapsa ligni]|uniref:hypothetical protein n=1 Tax=Acidicapsa ligni TaxID=542300 RepID=UPI0021DF797E|nr:hypothetical protein [Acidicapsa ligni]
MSTTQQLLVQSSAKAPLGAPFESIDIPEWLFTIADAEYQRCSVNHIAAASSINAAGKRMSLNVEHVGVMMVQHYVEELAKKQHCRVISITDLFFPDKGRTTCQVTWELIATPVTKDISQLENVVLIHTTPDLENFIERNNMPLDQIKASFKAATEAHNAEETPLFANSIARKSAHDNKR